MGLIADMTPQPYPLTAVTESHGMFLVLGWTADDKPVVVQQTFTRQHRPSNDVPHVLEEPVRYRTPYQDVTVDGEVEAKVTDDVQVRATVSGIERNEAIRITSDD